MKFMAAGASFSGAMAALRSAVPADVKGRILAMYALLVGVNAGAWLWALIAFRDHPVLLGTAFLAYAFGLRHAVDADHITAIDSVTRKLMQQGRRPVAVGFCFSLGHSTIVFALSAVIALTSAAIKSHFASFESIGGLVGTAVSALFLLAIAVANFCVFLAVYQTFQRVKRGGQFVDEDLNLVLARRGFFGRIFRNTFRLVQHSWQMYFVGFLFGLGFDTATEVGLLGISATEATRGLSVWTILVFPTLFMAGMALVDTTDSILMLGAYGWAFLKPVRKLYYNLTITFVSVLVALIVGGIQVLGLINGHLNFHGVIWDTIRALDDHFGMVGFAVIGLFALTWGVSILIYRLNRYDEIEVNNDLAG
jgi:nickel/cobalt transporter (NiCoT) family protein